MTRRNLLFVILVAAMSLLTTVRVYATPVVIPLEVAGTSVISADSIYVGRDVTNTKEYGDVILGQGNITLKAGYVEIKNSTTVPLGTTLTIEN